MIEDGCSFGSVVDVGGHQAVCEGGDRFFRDAELLGSDLNFVMLPCY